MSSIKQDSPVPCHVRPISAPVPAQCLPVLVSPAPAPQSLTQSPSPELGILGCQDEETRSVVRKATTQQKLNGAAGLGL